MRITSAGWTVWAAILVRNDALSSSTMRSSVCSDETSALISASFRTRVLWWFWRLSTSLRNRSLSFWVSWSLWRASRRGLGAICSAAIFSLSASLVACGVGKTESWGQTYVFVSESVSE